MITSTSVFNRLALGVLLAGAVWSGVHGRWPVVVLSIVGGLYAIWAIWQVNRGQTSDVSRLDSAQPLDERDRALLDRALAWVGGFAVLLELGIFLWRLGAGFADDWGSSVRLPLLCAVWLVANRVVVRRGSIHA